MFRKAYVLPQWVAAVAIGCANALYAEKLHARGPGGHGTQQGCPGPGTQKHKSKDCEGRWLPAQSLRIHDKVHVRRNAAYGASDDRHTSPFSLYLTDRQLMKLTGFPVRFNSEGADRNPPVNQVRAEEVCSQPCRARAP